MTVAMSRSLAGSGASASILPPGNHSQVLEPALDACRVPLALAERMAFVKTKIIATVGPASAAPAVLRALIEAGVDLFRLNFAHGDHDWLAGIVAQVRSLSEETGRTVGLLGDLAGPKIRLGELAGGAVQCAAGVQF